MTFNIDLEKVLSKAWQKTLAWLSLIPLSYAFGLRILPGWINWAASLFIGLVCIYVVVAFAHERLKARGKNGWWLLLFFGPHAAICFALERWLPYFSSRHQILVFIFSGLLSAPFFIWGLFELTAKRPQSPTQASTKDA